MSRIEVTNEAVVMLDGIASVGSGVQGLRVSGGDNFPNNTLSSTRHFLTTIRRIERLTNQYQEILKNDVQNSITVIRGMQELDRTLAGQISNNMMG